MIYYRRQGYRGRHIRRVVAPGPTSTTKVPPVLIRPSPLLWAPLLGPVATWEYLGTP